MTKADFASAVQDGTIEKTLHRHTVKPGDVILMPAGRVHALGAGLIVLEIQQTSTITYRLHDWGRLGADGKPRELHVEKALDVIDFDDTADPLLQPVASAEPWGTRSLLAATQYFVTELWNVDGEVSRETSPDGPEVLMCLEGDAELAWEGGTMGLTKGATLVLPARLGTYRVKAEAGPARMVHARLPGSDPLRDWMDGEQERAEALKALCDGWVGSIVAAGRY